MYVRSILRFPFTSLTKPLQQHGSRLYHRQLADYNGAVSGINVLEKRTWHQLARVVDLADRRGSTILGQATPSFLLPSVHHISSSYSPIRMRWASVSGETNLSPSMQCSGFRFDTRRSLYGQRLVITYSTSWKRHYDTAIRTALG